MSSITLNLCGVFSVYRFCETDENKLLAFKMHGCPDMLVILKNSHIFELSGKII